MPTVPETNSIQSYLDALEPGANSPSTLSLLSITFVERRSTGGDGTHVLLVEGVFVLLKLARGNVTVEQIIDALERESLCEIAAESQTSAFVEDGAETGSP